MPAADFVVVGAGIAGASLAYHLSRRATVILLERESRPGYHTTGRSAAFYVPSYGDPGVRPLTLASRAFFQAPPAGFADTPLLRHRPALYIARADQEESLTAFYNELTGHAPNAALLDAQETLRRAPRLRPDYVQRAVLEPDCYDIDVAALHQGYLRGFKQRSGTLANNAEVTALSRKNGQWRIMAGSTQYEAPVIVNAAGAWGDQLAEMAGAAPTGLTPMRRTVITFPAPEEAGVADWPLTFDIGHSFYFKPESGRILASPADETPTPPSDVQPEDLDVAQLVERLETATTLSIPRIENRWAGLRTFAPDRRPVIGYDDSVSGFFWLAGQGGFGIQTAPAAAQLAESLAMGEDAPAALRDQGITAESYGPARLR